MTVINRSHGAAAGDPALMPWVRLSADPRLLEIARAVDDGWREIEALSDKLAAISAPAVTVPTTDDLARRLVEDPTADRLTQMVDAAAQTSTDSERATTAQRVLVHAEGLVSDRGIAWMHSHVDAMCVAVGKRRTTAHATLRNLSRGHLADVQSERDFNGRPEAASAFADALRTLAEWDEWSTVHADLLAPLTYEPRTPCQNAERTWPGSTWIDDYESAWPRFWHRTYEGPQSTHAEPPRFAQGDLKTLGDLERIHVLGRVERVWTPNLEQLSKRVRDLTSRAHELAQNARDADREPSRPDYRYKPVLRPAPRDAVTGART